MFELEVAFEGVLRLDSLGRRLRKRTDATMHQMTDLLYEKVMENVSGRILHKKTGALAQSIHKSYEANGDLYVGEVFVSPVTDKAQALEYGGKAYYPIFPSKATVLKFFWEREGRIAYFRRVNHPPSKEYAYLRAALAEVDELVPRGFRENIQAVIDGGDYGAEFYGEY